MPEPIESPRPQQPPFTEEALKRRSEWLKTASEAITKQPQSNIDRIFLLREFRTAGLSSGYKEKVEPRYEDAENKNSDITMVGILSPMEI